MRIGHYLDRVQTFYRGGQPHPLTINLDPTSRCDLRCEWCNSWRVLGHSTLTPTDIECLDDQLEGWGVQSMCVSGGGEPTLSPYLDIVWEMGLRHNLAMSLTTNGQFEVPSFTLEGSKWVGFSVDAANPDTYRRLKGGNLQRVTENIAKAVEFKRKHGLDVEVTFKYVIYPGNEGEISTAYDLAVSLGCDAFHIRPVAWRATRDGGVRPLDTSDLDNIHEVPGTTLRVIDHRFATQTNTFPRCMSWMSPTVQANGKVGFCPDQKGLPTVTLCDLPDLRREWMGPRHREMLSAIDPTKCPTCAYTRDWTEMESVKNTHIWM